MVKIRIYELARDLNMNNKTLLEKLKSMGISVGNHMSSLDNQTVAMVKANLFGTKTDAVEITRVKPTVIRRRKKSAKKEPVSAIEITEPVLHPEECKALEKPSKETFEVEETEAAEKEVTETAPEKVTEAAPEKVASSLKRVDAKSRDLPEPSIEPEVEPQKPPVIKKTESEEIQKKKTPGLKTLQPPKIKKKSKKETPAKIIKLAVAPEKEKPVEMEIAPIEKPAEDVKLPKTKERTEEEILAAEEKSFPDKKLKSKEIKGAKKKAPFRRKEVVEGDALYAKENRYRKGKKWAKEAKNFQVTKQKTQITTPKAIKRRIKIDDAIVLSELAKRMGVKAGEIIRKLMSLGVMITVNQTIDFETAALVATEFNYELERASFEEETVLHLEKDDPDKLVSRPPVVTIMGHVDHGKTSLLDVIRKTRITEIEAGGITQHIGAYNVSTKNGQIVFLDTPGHEAFTAMRARGAEITDIVVLVVAADDGVMPQTIEAVNHSKASNVPIIVAVNKIDKPNAEPDRVLRELAEIGLVPEEWGGNTIFVKVSAKKNQGIEELLEMIILQSEMLELEANPDKLAKGHVIEAKLDAGRGAVASILIQEGTLHAGDPVVCGMHYGKVRAMLNDRGVHINSAGPSTPVEVVGLTGVPTAGDEFITLANEKSAKQVSIHRIQKQRSKELAKSSRLSLEGLFEKMKKGVAKDMNLIVKADVDGSIEAIRDSLVKLSNEEVKINIIHSATGTITESDISLAAVSDAIIIGFNVRPNAKVSEYAAEENVDIRYHNIIYNVIKEVKDAIVGMMSSKFEERLSGRAEVRETFHVPKIGMIAGCYVTDGKVERGSLARLIRDGIVCYEGKVSSLRRFKDDVKEVQSGYECGLGIENFNDIKVGDIIECYYVEEIKPEFD